MGGGGPRRSCPDCVDHSGKLPKHYNPDIPPDPERWLPRWERSRGRGGRKRKHVMVGKGTQGSASGAPPPVEVTGPVKAAPVAQSKGPPAQAKKKKKGKR